MALWPNMSVFVGNKSTNSGINGEYLGVSIISIQNNVLTSLPNDAFAGWNGEWLDLNLQFNNITRIASDALIGSTGLTFVACMPRMITLILSSTCAISLLCVSLLTHAVTLCDAVAPPSAHMLCFIRIQFCNKQTNNSPRCACLCETIAERCSWPTTLSPRWRVGHSL
jgi:hypothetical protein